MTAIEKLKITDDIRALMARYVRNADNKNFSELASLFTENGTFTPLDVNGIPLIVMAGRNEIAETISTSVGQAVAIHHLFSFEVEIQSETEVHGVFSMEDRLIRPESEESVSVSERNVPAFRTLHGFGHYHGDFVKIDGKWHIAKLVQTRIKLDFTY